MDIDGWEWRGYIKSFFKDLAYDFPLFIPCSKVMEYVRLLTGHEWDIVLKCNRKILSY